MSSPRNVRAREQEKRLQAIQAQEAAAVAYQRKQQAFAIGGLAVLVIIVGAVITAGVKTRSTDVATGQLTTTTSSSVPETSETTTNTAPTVSVPPAAPGLRMVGDTPCPKLDGSEARYTSFEKPPPMCMDPKQSYDVVIHTTLGDIKAQVGNPLAAEIVNNFITLAAYHYYDDAPIDFAMERGWWEAGDLVANTGTDTSPGYTITYTGPEQILTSIVVGMQIDPATKAVGGRLIVGFGEQTTALPAGTPSIGLVLDGMDPNLALGKVGTATGAVTQVNKITGITITPGRILDDVPTSSTPGSGSEPSTTVAPADASVPADPAATDTTAP